MDVLEEKPIINQSSENNAGTETIKTEKSIDLGIDYIVPPSCGISSVSNMATNSVPTAKTTDQTNRFPTMAPQQPPCKRQRNGRRSKASRNKNITCETCGMTFDQLSNLKIHQDNAHKVIKYVNCNKCDRVFCGMKDLEQHWKGTGICRKCKQNFYYPCVLIRHKCPGATAKQSTAKYNNSTSTSYSATGSSDANTTAQQQKTTQQQMNREGTAADGSELNHQKRPLSDPLTCDQPAKAAVLGKDITDATWCTWTVQNKPPKHACKECGIQFEKLTDLSKHQEKVREMEGIPRCPKCYKFFNNMNEAHLHLVGSGFCLKCGKDMELPCMLNQHICPLGIVPSIARATAGVISMVNVVCTICSVKFQSQESYVAHLRNDHNVNTDELLCKECGLIFSKKADLTAHEEMFHNNELHRCYKCLKIFRERYKLNIHQQGSGVCMLCGEDLEMPCMLVRHICKVNPKEQLARLQQNQDQSQANALQEAIQDNNEFLTTFCTLCKTKFQNHAIYLAHVRMYHCLNLTNDIQ